MAQSPSYYSSAATGAGGGASWANADTTLAAALGDVSNGGIIAADSASAEAIGAATTITGPASVAGRVSVVSVNKAGAVPPGQADYTPGAKLTIAASYNLTVLGAMAFEGFGFVLGSGTGVLSNLLFGSAAAAVVDVVLGRDTTVQLNSSNASALIAVGSSAAIPYKVTVRGGPAKEPKFKFGAAGQSIQIVSGALVLRSALVIDPNGSSPSNLFVATGARAATIDAEACDFTKAGANLLNVAAATAVVTASFRDCLIPSTTTLLNPNVVTNATLAPSSRISAVRCGPPGTILANYVQASEGGQVEDTTATLSGGSTENGTARSWLITATGTATPGAPYEAQPILIGNDQVGSTLTVAIEGMVNAASLPTNVDIWLEVEELGSAAFAPGVTVSNGLAGALAASVAHPSSTAAWSSVPAGWTQFRMVVSVKPTQKGYLKITPKVGKSSGVFRLDPLPIVSGGPAVSRAYTAPSGTLINETASTVTNTVTTTVYAPVGGRRSPR